MVFDVNSLLFSEFVAIYAVICAVSLVLPRFSFAVLQLLILAQKARYHLNRNLERK